MAMIHLNPIRIGVSFMMAIGAIMTFAPQASAFEFSIMMQANKQQAYANNYDGITFDVTRVGARCKDADSNGNYPLVPFWFECPNEGAGGYTNELVASTFYLSANPGVTFLPSSTVTTSTSGPVKVLMRRSGTFGAPGVKIYLDAARTQWYGDVGGDLYFQAAPTNQPCPTQPYTIPCAQVVVPPPVNYKPITLYTPYYQPKSTTPKASLKSSISPSPTTSALPASPSPIVTAAPTQTHAPTPTATPATPYGILGIDGLSVPWQIMTVSILAIGGGLLFWRQKLRRRVS